MNWIILRGLVREKRHWGKFTEILESELDGNAKIFPIDLPGFGTEIHRHSPTTVPKIVMDLRTRWLRDYAQTEGDWGILAVSLGGMCALQWAADFPNDFKKVVLINSSVSGLSPLYKRMIPQNYPTVFKIMAEQNLFEREKLILKMTTNLRGEAMEALARQHADFLKDAPPTHLNAVAQLMAAIRFKAPKKVQVPMLVLSSDGDTLVSPECSVEIAKHYHAKQFVHSGGNHDLPADDPHWIVKKINEWNRV